MIVNLFKAISVLSVLLLMLVAPTGTLAQDTNNKFGIHIVDENDLPEAAALVNSTGGEWGYVTLVIREDERDVIRWQQAFDQMRRLKLIPIVRLATKMNNSHWEVPRPEEAVNWAGFLNSLNWPVKTRYIVLFNEPNHAKEWGGRVDPAGFAETITHYHKILKSFSSDFFTMAGSLDLAAPNSQTTMEAGRFFSGMHSQNPFIFTLFDGLASHSYPNPGFSGSVSDSGKTSIKGYEWEINYLSNLGLDKDIPIFITETGWIKGSKELENNYKTAFEHVWANPQIVAITPFLLSYLDEPFEDFSWKDPASRQFLPQYYSVQSITKPKGVPEQVHSFELKSHGIADYLVRASEYSFPILLENTGQSIWNASDGFRLVADETTMKPQNIKLENLQAIEPGQSARPTIRLITNEPRGIHTLNVALYKNDLKIGDVLSTRFTLVSSPSVTISANFPFGNSEHVSLQMYDNDFLITGFDNLSFTENKASIKSLKNVIPNKTYKFKLSKPFYLSSYKEAKLLVGSTEIDFGILLPIDPSGDGELNFEDLLAYFANPLAIIVHYLQ